MATLFRDVRIFDGKGSELSAPCHVLVEGNTIARISQEPIPVEGEVSVIEGRGRTLMPGLIDAHWHTMLCGISMEAGLMADVGFVNLLAGRMAEATLMRGFTAVRDLGGPSFGLKMAIDKGLVAGPRIWPAGAFITQTGGHGDFRLPIDIPRWGNQPHYIELIGLSAIVDSPDQVRLRAREQLAKGACFLKLTAGGGISSHYDPIDVAQFTEAELRAAVEAAENWNTYVAVHVYTPRAIRQAIEAGVRSIEHGHLVDEATVELMAERGVWWSLQPFLPEHAKPPADPSRQAKQEEVYAGTDRAYQLAIKYGVKTAWGTDILFDAERTQKQNLLLVELRRWYSPAEVLHMATSVNAELLALSGPRTPYPGKLGVVEEGALADLLLVDGNPLANLDLIADPHRNFVVIMKDGVVYKDVTGKRNA